MNKWTYTPTPSIRLHVVYNDRFTFYKHLTSDANSSFYQILNQIYTKGSPVTGLEWPWGFQEV
jgi:hypothetical protein